MTPEFQEIRMDELRADAERQAEWAEREAQPCADCKHALWFGKYGSSLSFCKRVGSPVGLGACVLNGDFDGITTADNTLTMDCDYFEAVDE